MADDDDSGISRCGISGLFDYQGNPAALASGWLQMVETKTKRKKHRYFVMTPTTLAYFATEEQAGISDDGFMYGDADHDSLSTFKTHGASIKLTHVSSIVVHSELPVFTITMKNATSDGTSSISLECANMDIAIGWTEALKAQIMRAGSVAVPVRRAAVVDDDENALAGAGRAVAGAIGGFASLFSRGGGGGGSGATRADDEYFYYTPWADKEIDLMSKNGARFLANDDGAPAAIIFGWLTKRDRSGLRAGKGERDRFFVLTPQALNFFADQKTARIEDGYMVGKAEGVRAGGLFNKTGGRLALEGVVDIKFISFIDEDGVPSYIDGSAFPSRSGRMRTDIDADLGEDDPERDKEAEEKAKRKAAKEAAKAAKEAAKKEKKEKKKAKKAADSDEEEEDDESSKRKSKKAKKAADSDEEEDEDDAAAKRKSKKAKKAADSDEEEEEEDASSKRKSKKVKKAADSDEEEEEDESSKRKSKKAKKAAESDEEEEEEEEDAASKRKSKKVKETKPSKASSGGAGAEPEEPVEEPLYEPVEDPEKVVLFELDFGENTLILNAHNARNRTMWIKQIRKWAVWRKKEVDKEMLSAMAGAEPDEF